MEKLIITSKKEKLGIKNSRIKDKDGYYKVTFGTINSYNRNGEYYRVKNIDQIFGPNSVLGSRINDGLLISEYGHPKLPADKAGVQRETLKLRHNNSAAHIKKIELYNTYKVESGFNLPVYKVYGWVKPYGTYKDILQEALDNDEMNIAFSVRSLVKRSIINGVVVKDILLISTYDWVYRGGIKEATVFDAAGIEQEDLYVEVTDMDLKEIVASMEGSSTICKDGKCVIEGIKQILDDKPPMIMDLK